MNYEVTKEGGLFVLREFNAPNEPIVAVQGFNAQMIQDYANANYPAGTVIEWNIRPAASKYPGVFLDLRVATVCLAVALIFRLAFDNYAAAQDAVAAAPAASQQSLSFYFSDGEQRTWLTVVNHDPRTTDFHPSFTNIVCDYKPVIRKIGDRYEITFVSEIAQDLP
jgi:hypothetical protein